MRFLKRLIGLFSQADTLIVENSKLREALAECRETMKATEKENNLLRGVFSAAQNANRAAKCPILSHRMQVWADFSRRNKKQKIWGLR